MVAVACGIDWAQDHHDVAVVDETGVVVASVRINDDAAGLSQVLARRRVNHRVAWVRALIGLFHGEQPAHSDD